MTNTKNKSQHVKKSLSGREHESVPGNNFTGITIGKYAIIEAGAIVTKYVPDYAVEQESLQKVVQTLDESKFTNEN